MNDAMDEEDESVKGDAGTKPALDKDAWGLFKEKELYKRLALIYFEGIVSRL